jgi:hypothetical protein
MKTKILLLMLKIKTIHTLFSAIEYVYYKYTINQY